MDAQQIIAQFQLTHTGHQTPFKLDVNLKLPGQGVTVLFGQSGSGKTTLLRCIAGLQQVHDGNLWVNGECWQSRDKFVPTHKRPLGYVFQESSLFPHLSARGNLDFALKRAFAKPDRQRFDQTVALMEIEHLMNRYPAQLSGGERQRVAIARALLIQPRILLMDEPLASLDYHRKNEILPYLEQLRTETRIPIIYVSHSADEVSRLADFIVVMQQGKALAQGPLNDVLASLELPIKLGEDTGIVVTGTVIERDVDWHLVRVAFDGGELWVRDDGDAVGTQVRIRVLARDISLANTPHKDTSIVNVLPCTLEACIQDTHPAMTLSRVKVGNTILIARTTRRSLDRLQLEPGNTAWVQIKSVAVVR